MQEIFDPIKKPESIVPSAKELKTKEEKTKKAMGSVIGAAKFHAFNSYNTFKKSHRMVAW